MHSRDQPKKAIGGRQCRAKGVWLRRFLRPTTDCPRAVPARGPFWIQRCTTTRWRVPDLSDWTMHPSPDDCRSGKVRSLRRSDSCTKTRPALCPMALARLCCRIQSKFKGAPRPDAPSAFPAEQELPLTVDAAQAKCSWLYMLSIRLRMMRAPRRPVSVAPGQVLGRTSSTGGGNANATRCGDFAILPEMRQLRQQTKGGPDEPALFFPTTE